MQIIAYSIKEAWPKVLKAVISNGYEVEVIADGVRRKTIELEDPLLTTIKQPLVDMIPTKSKYNKVYLKNYTSQLIYGEHTDGFDYNYHGRIFEYPQKWSCDDLNQIDEIIDRLYDDQSSRKEIAIIWNPEEDLSGESTVPCLCLLDFKLRNGLLNMNCYFRSHDLYGAWSANAYVLSRLLEYVALELKVGVGKLNIVSSAGHIYIEDYNEAVKVIGGIA